MKLMFLATMLVAFWANNSYSQNHHIMTNQEIVKNFLEGFNKPDKIAESLALLSDDYHFKNPMVELNTKAEFIELAGELGQVLTGVTLNNITTNNNWVAAYYEFKSSIPGLERNIASEWFRIEDGFIKESHLIYDATEWRKVYGKMNK